jgi:hypothetical protein
MFTQSEVACLIPTLLRPFGLTRVLQSLKDTAPDIHCVVARDPDDEQAVHICTEYKTQLVTMPEKRLGCMKPWNKALRAAPDFKAYIVAADDLQFNPNWWQATVKALEKINWSGFVGFNDLRKNAYQTNATAYLMTRDFIVQYHCGVVVWECYACDFTDLESDLRARRAGKWIWAQDAFVPHLWLGKQDKDDVSYKLAAERRPGQREIYEARLKAGFPDDQERIIT